MYFHVLGNVFLVGFGFDAALSLLDDSLGQPGGLLSILRNVLGSVVLGFGFAIALLTPISRQLPIRIFGLPLMLTAWWMLGALPLSLMIDDPLQLARVLSSVQLAASAFAFAMVRFSLPGASWLLPRPPDGTRDFEPLRALGLGAAAVVGVPILLAGYMAMAVASFAHEATNGFIHLDTEGVHIVDRRYQKDGHEIRLIGMIHIGSEDVYAKLFESFAQPGTLVLEEGISDREGVLADRAPYDAFAEPLGLARQQATVEYLAKDDAEWPEVLRDDLDASEFRPETLVYLAGIGEASQALVASDFETLLEVLRRPEMQGAHAAGFFEDILTRRDEHLAAVLEASLPDYPRIVVPWGALHQRALSALVESWGYQRTGEKRHLAIAWGEVGKGLSF